MCIRDRPTTTTSTTASAAVSSMMVVVYLFTVLGPRGTTSNAVPVLVAIQIETSCSAPRGTLCIDVPVGTLPVLWVGLRSVILVPQKISSPTPNDEKVDLEWGRPLLETLPQGGVASRELIFPFPLPLPVSLAVVSLLTDWF